MSDEEYRLYAQMHAPIAAQLPEPDLVIWLQARPETLLARLRQRGIAMEQQIELDYLERLADAYVEHFDSYAGAPVFAVDAEEFNPLAREADLTGLIEGLERFDGRRGSLVLGRRRAAGLSRRARAGVAAPTASRRPGRCARRCSSCRSPPAPTRRRGRRRSASPGPTC